MFYIHTCIHICIHAFPPYTNIHMIFMLTYTSVCHINTCVHTYCTHVIVHVYMQKAERQTCLSCQTDNVCLVRQTMSVLSDRHSQTDNVCLVRQTMSVLSDRHSQTDNVCLVRQTMSVLSRFDKAKCDISNDIA